LNDWPIRVKLGVFCKIFVLIAALAGYSSWLMAMRGRQQSDLPLPAGQEIAGIPLIALDQARALWQEPATLFLDVRSAADYEVGHIAGAINLPDEEFAQRFAGFRPRFERARTIVVYCKSKDCGKSLWTALRLRNEGLLQTRIYPYGWNEWYLADQPIARGSR
jgi:rhodanese-related sulfurtransferase